VKNLSVAPSSPKLFSIGKRFPSRRSIPANHDVAPSIKSLTSSDLFSIYRLEALYIQAVESNIIQHNEKNVQGWVSAAMVSRINNPPDMNLFLNMIVKQHWEFIPKNIQNEAQKLIFDYRRKNPLLFNP
jgi:hypothetical protein